MGGFLLSKYFWRDLCFRLAKSNENIETNDLVILAGYGVINLLWNNRSSSYHICHNTYNSIITARGQLITKPLRLKLLGLMLSKSKHIICISDVVKKDIERTIFPTSRYKPKITKVYNPLDSALVRERAAEPINHLITQELQILQINFFFDVSTCRRKKNFNSDGCSLKSKKSTNLIVLGKGPLERSLKKITLRTLMDGLSFLGRSRILFLF